jgi:predicted RNA binding protein YcfA (HicA-like mRNA interferase family)
LAGEGEKASQGGCALVRKEPLRLNGDVALFLDDFGVKVRDIIRLIEDDDWFLVATRGSHRQYKHASKPGRVTIAGKPSEDMAPGTLNSVLKQAGLKERK